MWSLIKRLVYLVIALAVLLAALAYLGPYLGFDMAADQETITQPVELNIEG